MGSRRSGHGWTRRGPSQTASPIGRWPRCARLTAVSIVLRGRWGYCGEKCDKTKIGFLDSRPERG
eukprot:10228460-Prorocentrum_lima.AAC.1